MTGGRLSINPRTAGILTPVFSLRSEHDLGIGDTSSLKDFIELGSRLGFGFIQLLPINETGQDNSPYNAISAMAIDPLTLDCGSDTLVDLQADDYVEICSSVDLVGIRGEAIQYQRVRQLKHRLLRKAFQRFMDQVYNQIDTRSDEFKEFCDRENWWLDDYCMFRMLMEREGGKANWQEWSEDYNTAKKARSFVETLFEENPHWAESEALYYAYVQWIAFSQWGDVAGYAEAHDMELMGDIPFGVSVASADVFGKPEFFDLEWFGGAPPEKVFKADEFVEKWGQNWGIPLYNWNALKSDGYQWWKERIRKTVEIFGSFRIDHALGFYRIYSFPWNPVRNDEFLPLTHDQASEKCGGRSPGFRPRPDDSEENRNRNQMEGERYFRMMQDAAKTADIIAEDLGHVPDYVRPSLARLGIPGMKVPQWEFTDGRVTSGVSYPSVSFATYATHDHAPMRVQWEAMKKQMAESEDGSDDWHGARHFLQTLCEFSGLKLADEKIPDFDEEFQAELFRHLSLSNSERVAFLITDFLDDPRQINVPGVMDGSNWTYRMKPTVNEVNESKDWKDTCDFFYTILVESGRAVEEDSYA